MRQLLLLFLIFCLSLTPARAQTKDASIFEVTDIAVDVVADSAAHARDEAIIQAQRTGFGQLLERLGAPASASLKLSDDDIAALVQNFEVQNERSSAVRYIAVFTVQFKPNAVRTYLSGKSLSFSETRSQPVLVLPVFVSNGHPVLWEETTRWRTAWDNQSRKPGTVPVILPSGGLDDIAILSSEEAVAGKTDAIKAIIDKYSVNGAVVAVLTMDANNPGAGLTLDVQRYDADGNSLTPDHLTLPPTDKGALDMALQHAVKMVRMQLEKDWRQEAKQETQPAADVQTETPPSGDASLQASYDLPTARLPVIVPVGSLAEWAQIRSRLTSVPNVSRVDVITLARGSTNIEIEFRGGLNDLQNVLMQQNLRLNQDITTGAWTLRPL